MTNEAADKKIRKTIEAIAGANDLYAHAHGTGAAAASPASPAEALVAAHHVKNMLSESVFYPAHKKRSESAGYTAIHRQMVKVEDRPCLACGVRQSTLHDPASNPFGAKALETHHHIIEWALANAIDLAKFNSHVIAGLRRRNPADPKYATDLSQQQMLDWIDHDRDNLWVLCDVHHRHKYVGIHAITFPIWGPQDLLVPNFGPRMADEMAATPAEPGG